MKTPEKDKEKDGNNLMRRVTNFEKKNAIEGSVA